MQPSRNRVFGAVIVGALAIAAASVGFSVVWPVSADTVEATVTLKKAVEMLPAQTVKSYSLRVPRDGHLVLEVLTRSPGQFNAYLVRMADSGSLSRAGGLEIMPEFSVKDTRYFGHRASVKRGNYHLMLVNFSADDEACGLLVGIDACWER